MYCSANALWLGEVGLGSGLTGKLGHAWDGAWVGAWVVMMWLCVGGGGGTVGKKQHICEK